MKSKKIVKTVRGEELPKSKTRNIGGEYYKIGDNRIEGSGDCYLIDNKYYRYDTGYIIYDHRDKIYKIYNQNDFIKRGLIGFDENNNPIFGGFSIIEDMIQVYINGKLYCSLNEDILINSKNYLEELNTGIYYNRNDIDSYKFIFPSHCDIGFKYNLPYDSRNILKSRIDIFNQLFEEDEIDDTVKLYSPYLKDLTFGLEFETIKGNIPERICKKLGLIALRDGSIDGLEFVTIPLQGDKGLQTLINSLKQLDKRTTYNDSCSLHLHIGNIPRTEEFILALFKLLCFIQDELFELFPLYKKYNFGYKKKHYTKPFSLNQTLLLMDNKITEDNIKKNFNILFEYLSAGISYSNYNYDLNNVKSHPSDPNGTSKWHIKSRYASINLIPLLFGNKETVEFRLHTPTYDINKVINYLFICSSIINYAKENQNNILNNPTFLRNISLNNILYNITNNTLVDHLSRYIADRKNFVYNQNRNSKIHFQEDEYIPQRNYIKWDGKNSVHNKNKYNYKYSNPMAEINNVNVEEIMQQLDNFRRERPVRLEYVINQNENNEIEDILVNEDDEFEEGF